MALFTRPRPADGLDRMVDYLVDTPDGPVGIVDGWERDEHGRPRALIVAQGWFGRRRFEVALDALLGVDDDDRRITLARGAAPLEPSGPWSRLVELGRDPSSEETAPGLPSISTTARPVLCGVADDPHAPAVVDVAARLATKLEASLVLAHVTSARLPPGVSAVPRGHERLREAERQHADALIDALLSRLTSDPGVTRIVARGTPAQTLEELARTERAQLLVIGAAGKRALGALLTGSVSQHVIGHASCPVVVVPPQLTRIEEEDDESPAIENRTDGRVVHGA